MTEQMLSNRRILIVEDEYAIAFTLREELKDVGATVLGPIGNFSDAMDYVADENNEIDGAILDVNLRGTMAFPIADRLIERDVPFLFSSGYDSGVIPDRFQGIHRCWKPVIQPEISNAISQVLEGSQASRR